MLDSAVFTFGSALQSDLDAVDGKTAKDIEKKRKRLMRRWLPDAKQDGPRFRDPAKQTV